MLDEKDRILVASLRRNARESLVGLARSVGLSRSATQERMRRLEREGVIKGYTVELASEHDPAVRAMIAVTFEPGFRCKHVVPRLSGIPEITACHSLTGSIDLMVMVSCDSNATLDRIRDAVAAVQGVATATTHIVLATPWARD
ncbi:MULTISPECIES: Lrp/AsnC family transcriptional regulator [Microvirga]|uniref:Lrp/AsnC family transcriptional regulator n=1 Tax=Microvirga TaxID=186650 RepID=UPI001CFD4D67|nr:Lrp/AsnC family transcriptional regulator [Microvirga lenta]MCB5173726.1 Lrp/AsnC family transcriptional regulator [Microvirga lenta]